VTDGKTKESKHRKYIKKWTLRKVVREKMGEEIIERAKQKARESRGSDDESEPEAGSSTAPQKGNLKYLPFHPAAWTEICKELDDEKRNEYLDLVDEWNNVAVPLEVQQKYVYGCFNCMI
jgi:hypothetical protein